MSEYKSAKEDSELNSKNSFFSFLLAYPGFLAVFVGNCLEVALSLPFFLVSYESIDPHVWTVLVFQVAIATALAGIPLSINDIIRKKRKIFGIFSFFLSFTPILVAVGMHHFAAFVKGFEIS